MLFNISDSQVIKSDKQLNYERVLELLLSLETRIDKERKARLIEPSLTPPYKGGEFKNTFHETTPS